MREGREQAFTLLARIPAVHTKVRDAIAALGNFNAHESRK